MFFHTSALLTSIVSVGRLISDTATSMLPIYYSVCCLACSSQVIIVHQRRLLDNSSMLILSPKQLTTLPLALVMVFLINGIARPYPRATSAGSAQKTNIWVKNAATGGRTVFGMVLDDRI